MITVLTHLQHVRDKHVIYVAILEEKTDDFNRRYYQLQLEGSKTALELPGVLDEAGSVLAEISASSPPAVSGGMLPKLEACSAALAGGVRRVRIGSGTEVHA